MHSQGGAIYYIASYSCKPYGYFVNEKDALLLQQDYYDPDWVACDEE